VLLLLLLRLLLLLLPLLLLLLPLLLLLLPLLLLLLLQCAQDPARRGGVHPCGLTSLWALCV
jgi:hypothetical protein